MRTESPHFTFLLASIAALTSLSIDMSLPSVPLVERQFGLLAGQGGLTLSVFLAGYALTPLIGGSFADRFGRRPLLLVSLGSFAASALACALAPTFRTLLAFRFLQGCASGVSTTLPLAIVRDLLQGAAARRRISEVTTINGMMPIVAPIFGTWIMSLGNWRFIFATQSAFAICICFAFLFNFHESLPVEHRQRLRLAQYSRNYIRLLSNRVFLIHSIIYALIFASMFSFISVSPLILMQRMGADRPTFTGFFVFIATGTVLGSFFSARASRKSGSAQQVIMGGLLCMLAASLLGAVLQFAGRHTPIAILPFVFLTLLGFGYAGPSVTVEALEPIPELAGAGSGALRTIFMGAGSGTSALLAYYCARHYDRSEVATTLTMSVTTLIALSMYLSLLRSTARIQEREQRSLP